MAVIPDILFSNQAALLATASVIPLIILYLLRPRTIDIDVPSLLFFIKSEQQRNKLLLLLRKLIRDPLFLIQLLVLILLSLAMAGPYMMEERVSGQHTVIVIDNSASMQAGGRLDEAKTLAVQRLSAINSVVWAQNVPLLALKEGNKQEAKEIIALTPQRAVSSDLAAAITYAERLAGPGGTVMVFSDFASWSGDDPLVARGLAEYNGVRVEFVQVGKPVGNIGIINGWFDVSDGTYTLNLAVKNFNDNSEKVSFTIRSGGSTRGGSLRVPGGSTRPFVVPDLDTGTTEISMDNGGALALDDTIYVVVPEAAGDGVLLVDSRESSPTTTALALLKVNVQQTTTLPADLSPYSMIILGDVDNRSLGADPGTPLSRFVEDGGVLVATASPALAGLGDLLPITITGLSNETRLTTIADSALIRDVPLSEVEVVRHIKGTAPEGAVVVLEASDASPMLAHWDKSEGTVVYLGLNDITGDNAWSGFNYLPEFPLFWKNLLDWLGGTDLDEVNVRTGTMIRLPATLTVTSPDGSTITTNNLWIDQTGTYQIGTQIVAANLYDAKESDVDDISIDAGTITSKYVERPETIRSDVRKDLSKYLIWGVFSLLLLELIVIMRRRELF